MLHNFTYFIMRKLIKFSVLLLCSLMVLCVSCSSDGPSVEPPTPPAPPAGTGDLYPWEESRTELLQSTDMVLIYGGGHHRNPYNWDTDMIAPYVTYMDKTGTEHWLFDAFLFLELKDTGNGGANKTYTYENQERLDAANQKDWKRLVDYYFTSSTGLGALNRAISNARKRLGDPKTKHRVVIAIPEPIVHKTPADENSTTVYWGSLNGHIMDFSIPKDRVDACKWYIDYVRSKFDEMQYQNIELAGFYWLAETAGTTRNIISEVADYVKPFKYSFNWIPYRGAEGHNRWESYGFSYTYYQPNYFFNTDQSYAVLEETCEVAKRYNMDMEFEFDYRVMASNPEHDLYYPRMLAYMKAFKDHKIWETKRLAYYEGGGNLLSLKNSSNEADRELYHELCQFIISRPIRSK